MKCTYRTREHRLLLEAGVGDLFSVIGPSLVECVCARVNRCAGAMPLLGAGNATACDGEDHPDSLLPIVVIACRVDRGEPEYFPAGFLTMLSGATPIAFLQQIETLALRPCRAALGDLSRPELASRL